VAVREAQGVEVVDVCAGAGGHHQVHRGRPDQGRVEVGAEQVGVGVVAHPIRGAQGIGGLFATRLGFGLVALQHVANGGAQESAGAAGRVQDPLVGLGVEHPHHELHGPAGGEVLAPVAAQVGADDLLIGGALGVHVGAAEVVLGQFRDHEGEGAVRQGDLLVALEDGAVALLHVFEQSEDALLDRGSTGVVELLGGTGPEADGAVALALVVHLAEDQIQELPEGGILGHALVAVDEVVAAAEGDAQHLVIGDAGMGIGDEIFGSDRLFCHRPVANGVAFSFEASLFLLYKEEF
jgi:hypothetical protein